MVLSIFMHGGDRGAAPIMRVYPRITRIFADFFLFYREKPCRPCSIRNNREPRINTNVHQFFISCLIRLHPQRRRVNLLPGQTEVSGDPAGDVGNGGAVFGQGFGQGGLDPVGGCRRPIPGPGD